MYTYRSCWTTLGLATALLVSALAVPSAAVAGCLSEFDDCGDCAEKSMRQAVRDLDLEGLLDAYVEGVDCEIDLVHCILYAHHHDYRCEA